MELCSWVLISFVAIYGTSPSFGDDPNTWPDKYPLCGGKRQSPINLPSLCTARYTPIFFKFVRSSATFKPIKSVEVSLNTHAVVITPNSGDQKITITGGPVLDNYIFAQTHFHWGSNNSNGSEHSINNKFYPMEVHLVHYNSKYGSFDKAATQPDGLLVIGFFYRVVKDTNDPAMNYLATTFRSMQAKGAKSVNITNFPAMSRLFPAFQDKFVTYLGSLTTPPCYESVTWVISTNPLPISERNMEAFRGFYKMEHGLINNFRPLQPLNGRIVAAKVTLMDKMNCFFNFWKLD